MPIRFVDKINRGRSDKQSAVERCPQRIALRAATRKSVGDSGHLYIQICYHLDTLQSCTSSDVQGKQRARLAVTAASLAAPR